MYIGPNCAGLRAWRKHRKGSSAASTTAIIKPQAARTTNIYPKPGFGQGSFNGANLKIVEGHSSSTATTHTAGAEDREVAKGAGMGEEENSAWPRDQLIVIMTAHAIE